MRIDRGTEGAAPPCLCAFIAYKVCLCVKAEYRMDLACVLMYLPRPYISKNVLLENEIQSNNCVLVRRTEKVGQYFTMLYQLLRLCNIE
jgi:hypothetical protein